MEGKRMQFSFQLMNEKDAVAVLSWHYEEPYAIYNMADDFLDIAAAKADMLDRRSPHYSVRNEQGELIGFFSFGSSGYVTAYDEPHLYSENNTITFGLGLRPDLTGQSKGLGLAFVNAGLDFARQQFAPDFFRLFVMTFNERAIKVYEQAGFQHVRVFKRVYQGHEDEFLEMSRPA